MRIRAVDSKGQSFDYFIRNSMKHVNMQDNRNSKKCFTIPSDFFTSTAIREIRDFIDFHRFFGKLVHGFLQ